MKKPTTSSFLKLILSFTTLGLNLLRSTLALDDYSNLEAWIDEQIKYLDDVKAKGQVVEDETMKVFEKINYPLISSTKYRDTTRRVFLEVMKYKSSRKTKDNRKYYSLDSRLGGKIDGDNDFALSQNQAYGMLGASLVLGSWKNHSDSSSDYHHWDAAVDDFEGFFNGWRKMCFNSDPKGGCQIDGKWCKDPITNKSVICLPGWKQSVDLSVEIGSNSSPDADADAILAMIIAIKAFKGKQKPKWYNELRQWADASCSAFLYFNTVTEEDNDYEHSKRVMKVGSCWGGFGKQGNSPTNYSPGHFKAMKDFHLSFPAYERSYSLPSEMSASKKIRKQWDQLIRTSYEVLFAVQCPIEGTVPNWAMVDIIGDGIKNTGDLFSGSGTPQWQYGTEAARTIWRVALDAALFPEDMRDSAEKFLKPILNTLVNGYNSTLKDENYFAPETFKSCYDRSTGNSITPFSGEWNTNAAILAPTLSALVIPIERISRSQQEKMLDEIIAALLHIKSENLDEGLYSRTWRILSIMMLSGAVETVGKLFENVEMISSKIPKEKEQPHATKMPTAARSIGCCNFGKWIECPWWTRNSGDKCHESKKACKEICNGEWILGSDDSI